jgi:hypothetical protein
LAFVVLTSLLQQSIKITPEDSRVGSSSTSLAKPSKAKATYKMSDLESFYTESDTWSMVLVPSYIQILGANPNAWVPTFNILKIMQGLRDDAYPNTTHKIDKHNAVYHIVCDARVHDMITDQNYRNVIVCSQLGQRAYQWRNAFGATALSIVSTIFKNSKAFDVQAGEKTTREAKIAVRVKYLLGDSLPWLWANGFEPPIDGTVRVLYVSIAVPHVPPDSQEVWILSITSRSRNLRNSLWAKIRH